ncbi:MAG: NADH-quinone oxidoreductase subunit C, partial [Actinomycetota bacterium]|nr:NADH-quinone oxidoreductase subunit C [Actinomycetota bacterium]
MPDAPGLELLLAEINRNHPGAVIDTSFDRDQASLIVDPRHILAILTWLKETPGQEYNFLSSVHGVDYLPAEPRFAVIYELLNRERYERLRIKALLTDPAVEAADTDVTVSGGTTPTSATSVSTTIPPATIAPPPVGGIQGEAPASGSEAGSEDGPTVSESEAA